MSEVPTPQDYRLIVTDSDGFKQSVIIHTIRKKYSVFIQTDKAIYKPNDKIQFRVLVLDAETKPYQYESLGLTITDAVGNVVHEVQEIFSLDLLYESHHQITEDPFLGVWTMRVQIDNDEGTKKTFEVNEYVLPRFEAFVETKKQVTLSDETMKLSVFAKYNFGEYVKGKATVVIKLYDSKYPNLLMHNPPHKQPIDDILNKKQLKINIASELKVKHAIRDIVAQVEVEFEEELTNKKMFVNETVIIRKKEAFLIDVIRPQARLKPGFPFKFTVLVKKGDGTFEKGGVRSVHVKAQFYYSRPKCTVKGDKSNTRSGFDHNFGKTLKNGFVDFVLDIPHNTSAVTLNVNYLDSRKTVNVTRFPSNSRDYLIATVKSKRFVKNFQHEPIGEI